MPVGVVVVSHSDQLARGVVELCAQMAPDVAMAAAGGTDEGGVGTSLDKTMAAIAAADDGDGVVVLADLGSAVMIVQSALELLEPAAAGRVLLADAPLVEGALAAATAAAGGAPATEVLAAAEAAGGPPVTAAPAADEADAEAEATLPNPLGLHARPAAQVIAALRDLDARVTIHHTGTGAGAPANSLLAMARLEALGGATLRFAAAGPDAGEAVTRLARMAAEGFGEAEETVKPPEPGADRPEAMPAGTLAGTPAAPGLALGPAAHPQPPALDLPSRRTGGDPDEERRRLDGARASARGALEALAADPAGDIFAAHLALLDDPDLLRSVERRLGEGLSAAWAWEEAIGEHAAALASSASAVFAERAADVRDVGRRVLAILLGAPSTDPSVPAGAVAVADDVVPSAVQALARGGAAAIVLGRGGRTAHAAVLARNLGLPCVVGLGAEVAGIAEGTVLRVDGGAGEVVVDPSPDVQERTRAAIAEERQAGAERRTAATAPGRTADGTRIRVAANAASVAEAEAAMANGAEGIGLLRTEFLFTDRPDLPSEDEQAAALSAICEALGGRPVIVRTLDVGGDKAVPSLSLDPVRHGFLGIRGLRLTLAEPELFRTQLRAVLRVAATHRVSVMFPMVTAAAEVQEARRALAHARDALDAARVPAAEPEEIGIMVEVPAVALGAAAFTEHVDFFSVGSNDLTAYTAAADRTLPEVADLAEGAYPAVLTLVRTLCAAAASAGCWTGVCGELAGDPERAVDLVRAGVRELSMAPPRIPDVKAALRQLDLTR